MYYRLHIIYCTYYRGIRIQNWALDFLERPGLRISAVAFEPPHGGFALEGPDQPKHLDILAGESYCYRSLAPRIQSLLRLAPFVPGQQTGPTYLGSQ